ncbi:MAG: hypothetical protein A3K45_02735 [Chloroflexi bacterium RIFOXYC12_FULL_59_14]|nr:MAG: hypothetical protein A3K45_02735 [Chloroflexi bacterium RIFOXYC12_FULL_59_14]
MSRAWISNRRRSWRDRLRHIRKEYLCGGFGIEFKAGIDAIYLQDISSDAPRLLFCHAATIMPGHVIMVIVIEIKRCTKVPDRLPNHRRDLWHVKAIGWVIKGMAFGLPAILIFWLPLRTPITSKTLSLVTMASLAHQAIYFFAIFKLGGIFRKINDNPTVLGGRYGSSRHAGRRCLLKWGDGTQRDPT